MVDPSIRSRALAAASGSGEYLFVESGARARCGRGWGVWAAIVAALGPAEVNALTAIPDAEGNPPFQDPVWEFLADDADFHKMSAVMMDNNTFIGTVYQCRSGV